MTWMIGIDEAGYGPNLGPLCIGATAWWSELQAECSEEPKDMPLREGGLALVRTGSTIDLYERLADVVSRVPDDQRIAIADSKQLYKPAGHSKQRHSKRRHSNCGLRHLERGVLTAMTVCGQSFTDWQELFSPPTLPWYANYNCPLPIDCSLAEVANLADRFAVTCQSAAVELVDIQTQLVYPEEFNQLTEHYGTKGAALSHKSMDLVKKVLANLPIRSSLCIPPHTPLVSITCDKHGGRNRYGALLQHHFPDHWIETIVESRSQSCYRWGPPEANIEICFRSQGEAELPVALASMQAKYHRELAMRSFNAFWIEQIPGLRPTAGYPQDAKRFKAQITEVQAKLKIEDRVLWRNR